MSDKEVACLTMCLICLLLLHIMDWIDLRRLHKRIKYIEKILQSRSYDL